MILGLLTRLLAISCFGIFISTCYAEEEEVINLQFVSFPKSDNPQPVELRIGTEKTLSVEIPTNSLSPVYKASALSEWSLGKSGLDKDGKFIFNVYGKTASIASKNQLIMVMRKGASDADGFELIAINNAHSNFGGGKYLFFNASKADIAGEIGDAKFVIKPNNNSLLAPNPSDESEDKKYLYIKLYFRKGEEAKPFYSSTWRFSEKARSMVFFYHEPINDRLKIHTIRDYLPQASP